MCVCGWVGCVCVGGCYRTPLCIWLFSFTIPEAFTNVQEGDKMVWLVFSQQGAFTELIFGFQCRTAKYV